MRPARWNVIAWLIGGVAIGLLMVSSPLVWAAVEGLDPEAEYQVTYQTGSTSAQTLGPAKITDIVELGSKRFLVVYLSGYKTKGYVDLESVRSILPTVR